MKPRSSIIHEDPAIRERSGEVNTKNLLDVFLYLLMRDYLTPGQVEDLMTNMPKDETTHYQFNNGYLARHAMDIRKRIISPKRKKKV